MRISDWSSDVCSSDLAGHGLHAAFLPRRVYPSDGGQETGLWGRLRYFVNNCRGNAQKGSAPVSVILIASEIAIPQSSSQMPGMKCMVMRSEEHTSELQSLMRNSYDVFCLKKKQTSYSISNHNTARTRHTYVI